jgi:hypothetical protein
MSRKLLVITVCSSIGLLLAASVFGGETEVLVEKVPSFFVSNDEDHPVPVREQGDPGERAFAFFESSSFGDGAPSPSATFTVPEGERLVIETVSVQSSLALGESLVQVVVTTQVNGEVVLHHIAPTFGGSVANASIFIAGGPRTLYADGGTEVRLSALRTNNSSGTFNASVAGHLIDCADCK